jgi:hypothetical protein
LAEISLATAAGHRERPAVGRQGLAGKSLQAVEVAIFLREGDELWIWHRLVKTEDPVGVGLGHPSSPWVKDNAVGPLGVLRIQVPAAMPHIHKVFSTWLGKIDVHLPRQHPAWIGAVQL